MSIARFSGTSFKSARSIARIYRPVLRISGKTPLWRSGFIRSRDDERRLEVNPLPHKAGSSIRCNSEHLSNSTDLCDWHQPKYDLQSTRTDHGIIIEVNPLHQHANRPIRSI
jgi:hypothetical protein